MIGFDFDFSIVDILMVGFGVYGMGGDFNQVVGFFVYLERMCIDIGFLKKQYSKFKQRQIQVYVIIVGQYSIVGQCSNYNIVVQYSNYGIVGQCSNYGKVGLLQ